MRKINIVMAILVAASILILLAIATVKEKQVASLDQHKQIQGSLSVTEEDLMAAITSGRFDKFSRDFLPDSFRTEGASPYCSDAVLAKPLKISNNASYVAKAGMEFDNQIAIDAVYEQLLRNPVYLNMMIEGFADRQIGDKTLAELNPWMKTRVKNIKKWFKPGGGGITNCLERTNDGKLLVSEADRMDGIRMALLLDRFVMAEKLVGRTSKEHYALPPVAEPAYARAFMVDYVENLPAIQFDYKLKNGESLLLFGINVFDGRLMFFSNEEPTVTPEEKQDNPKPQDNPTPPNGDRNPTPPNGDRNPTPPNGDGNPSSPKKKDKVREEDPLYNDKLNHEATGPNDDKASGKYEETPSVSWPSEKGAPKLKENQYNSDNIHTEITEVKPEKEMPVQKKGDTEYFVDPSSGKAEEIKHNDNVSEPEKKVIPVQPREDSIENDKINEGEVDINDI